MKNVFFTFKYLISRVYTWQVCSPQAPIHNQHPLPSRLSLLLSIRTLAMISSLDWLLLWSPSSTISPTSACKINDQAAICSLQSTFNRNPVNDDSMFSYQKLTTAENCKIVTEQVQIDSNWCNWEGPTCANCCKVNKVSGDAENSS